eukprot:COSAG02_NODE_8214_length_2656_cov_2.452269_2_plen_313_part_00
MMPPMQKMAAPLALASALCHVATVAVMMDMHIQLSTVQDMATGPHRALLDSDSAHDPFDMDPLAQTVARLEKAADAHGARLTAVEEDNAELTAILNKHMEEGHGGTGHGSRAGSRRMQMDGGNLHPQAAEPHADPVYIIKPNVTRITAAVRDGRSGHRRAQSGDGYGEGTCSDLESRSAEVTQVCCDEPEEDCTGGYPHSCNAGCAATFLPFWEECRAVLGEDSQRFEPVVELCTASAGTSGTASRPSLTEQLNLQCTDGTAAAECVPECSEKVPRLPHAAEYRRGRLQALVRAAAWLLLLGRRSGADFLSV